MTGRARLTFALVLVAAALAIAGWLTYSKETTAAADTHQSSSLGCALYGDGCKDSTSPNRAPATTLFILAGFAGISGVLVGANTPAGTAQGEGANGTDR